MLSKCLLVIIRGIGKREILLIFLGTACSSHALMGLNVNTDGHIVPIFTDKRVDKENFCHPLLYKCLLLYNM